MVSVEKSIGGLTSGGFTKPSRTEPVVARGSPPEPTRSWLVRPGHLLSLPPDPSWKVHLTPNEVAKEVARLLSNAGPEKPTTPTKDVT